MTRPKVVYGMGIGKLIPGSLITRKNRWTLGIEGHQPFFIASHLQDTPVADIEIQSTFGLTIFGLRNQPPIFDMSTPVALTIYDGVGSVIANWTSASATLKKIKDLSYDPNDTDVEAELVFHEPAVLSLTPPVGN